MADLTAPQKSMPFGADDVAALRQSKAILADQTEAIPMSGKMALWPRLPNWWRIPHP